MKVRTPSLTPEFVKQLAAKYPVNYDDLYFKNIDGGRQGDVESLKALTRWKNPNRNGAPMNFEKHRWKRLAWQYFIRRLDSYLPDGKAKLRTDFKNRAPVWAIFWHHVLFGTPIFDRYTNVAFSFFAKGKRLTRDESRIVAGHHWLLYDEYSNWFNEQLLNLQNSDPEINERTLDRALVVFGEELLKSSR